MLHSDIVTRPADYKQSKMSHSTSGHVTFPSCMSVPIHTSCSNQSPYFDMIFMRM